MVDLDPTIGSEASSRRPAVVVSNDGLNATIASHRRGVVTVVPITSNVTRIHPFQVLLERGTGGLRVDSKAQAEQIRAVAVGRVGDLIGRLTYEAEERLNLALRVHLGL